MGFLRITKANKESVYASRVKIIVETWNEVGDTNDIIVMRNCSELAREYYNNNFKDQEKIGEAPYNYTEEKIKQFLKDWDGNLVSMISVPPTWIKEVEAMLWIAKDKLKLNEKEQNKGENK